MDKVTYSDRYHTVRRDGSHRHYGHQRHERKALDLSARQYRKLKRARRLARA